MLARGLTAILAVCLCASGALAADLSLPPMTSTGLPMEKPMWDGFFLGVNAGADYEPSQSGTTNVFSADPTFSLPLPSTFDTSSRAVGGVGVQFGFQHQYDTLVVGGVIDYDLLGDAAQRWAHGGNLSWTNPIVNWSNLPYALNYAQSLSTLGTIRGRLGFAPSNDWMVYVTSGLAYGLGKSSANMRLNNGKTWSNSRVQFDVGGVVGAGVDYAAAPNWIVGVEGLAYKLNSINTAGTANFYFDDANGKPLRTPQFGAKAGISGFQLRLNAIYEFDGDTGVARSTPVDDPNVNIPIEVGLREGVSTGRTRLSWYDSSGLLVSRLSYSGTTALTAEPYMYFEIPGWNIFVAGNFGVGAHSGGNLQNEDYLPATATYSSTTSPLGSGSLQYGTLDVGYYGYDSDGVKLGGLLGYTFQIDKYDALGCAQTTTNSACHGANTIGGDVLIISDSFTWNAARLGLAASLALPGGARVSATAAWLPFISTVETNDRWLFIPSKFTTGIPGAGTGASGYQIEANATMPLGPNMDIGAGVRYQSISTKGAVDMQEATTAVSSPQVGKWSSDRLQAYLQTGFHF